MISGLNFAIALLKLANAILNWASQRELIDQGRREVIAEYALAIAQKMLTKEQIQGRVHAMSDAELDDALRNRGV